MAKTVRVDAETFRRLCEEAGRLEALLELLVSLDEANRHMAGSLKPSKPFQSQSNSLPHNYSVQVLLLVPDSASPPVEITRNEEPRNFNSALE